ncbi:Lipopolysaccharide biosynthesis protein WzxC [Palleronia abyssalis]|uniref:Lipopolysaccharide biosynthesis protein WzxC n=1 Tax=Palleronia abyssalis TaxID=1501240 RepID=A0A2R8BZG5_9RHOB|nr:Lipopolysaccharide biosynthesis protein WzxC [Palleronia abyssalis]
MITFIGFANTLVLARLLVPEDFGLVAIVMSISAIVFAVTELSLAQALVQHNAPTDSHYNTAFTLNLIRAAGVAIVLVVLSVPMAALYGDPRLVYGLMAIAVSSLVIGAINPKLAAMSRELVFWQDFATRSGDKLAAFLVAFLVAVIWQSYWALILGVIAGQMTSLILSYIICPYRPRFELSKWRDLMSFSIWVGLGQAVNTLNWRFDQLVLGYFLGNTALGYYSVGARLASLPTKEATRPVAAAAFPGFAKLAHDPERLRRAYQRAQSALMVVALPVGVGFAVAAEPLVLLVMGEKWLSSVVVIQVLASVFAIGTIATTVQPLALGMGQSRILFNRSLLNLGIRAPLTMAGLLSGGLVGLLVARCIVGFISIWINLYFVRELLGLSYSRQLLINRRSLIAVVVMAAAVYLAGTPFDGLGLGVQSLKAICMIAAGIVVYPAIVMLLWWCQGYPEGPEHDAMKLAKAILSKVSGRVFRR